MTWSKIVCAVDDSAASARALREAALLAKSLGAELTLVHVRARPAGGEPLFAPPAASGAQRGGPPVEAWVAEASRLRGGPVQMRVLSGDIAGELLAFVHETRADALVMGTHARRRMSLALGSSVARVLAGAELPVIVAQAPAEGAAAPQVA